MTDPLHRTKTTSGSVEFGTPLWLFRELNDEFKFDLDACATAQNKKVKNFFSITDDGLEQDWTQYRSVFVNPPYGKTIGLWLMKAYNTARASDTTVVCLVPANTDTSWWHDYCLKGEIRYIRGRLKFGGSKGRAPFPSAIVIFR